MRIVINLQPYSPNKIKGIRPLGHPEAFFLRGPHATLRIRIAAIRRLDPAVATSGQEPGDGL
jgi:hypothetical protein